MGIELGQARVPKGLRIYAVGDIHGCLDETRQMLAMIDDDLAHHPVNDHRIIFLGDYLDRGPQSKDVVAFLMALQNRDRRVTCLLGNHDLALLKFMRNPVGDSPMFLPNGGAQTLLAYGAAMPQGELSEAQLTAIQAFMGVLVSGFHIQFLKQLQLAVSYGDYFFCHAGIRPGVPLAEQDADDLIWIRDGFLDHAELFDKVIIHGHTAREAVDVRSNRINIDTKCHQTSVLTSVVLEGNDYRFLQTN